MSQARDAGRLPVSLITYVGWTLVGMTSPHFLVAIWNWSKVLPGSLHGKERKR